MAVEPVLIVHDNQMVGENLLFLAQKMALMPMVAHDLYTALAYIDKYPMMMVVACDEFGEEPHTAAELFHEMHARGLDNVVKIQVGGCEDKHALLTSVEAGMDDVIPYDMVDATFSSRLAIWIASEFKGLPPDLRRRALFCLRAEQENIRALDDRIALNTVLMRDVLLQIQNELEGMPETFGLTYIERMIYVARASLLLIKGGYEFEHFFRFPDLMYVITQGIDVIWRDEVPVLFSSFNDLALDARFGMAGGQPIAAYDYTNFKV
ncbi:hypothetical protein QGN29_13520 [Temperatibacter marinus]|uniref:Uncharacterized protein n=1 Tax=Temperatibacter marinus TaxID=1456591 RepID=A0AA52EBZ3_9PROT|nr:hypothetical protein [Temperatibacter marinus]WND02567.1 hypothetical protein QGN29_13520 [Temperatibacter marinus]